MVGMIAGVWVFAEAYVWLAAFVWSGEMGAVTLADLLGVPFWALAAAVLILALAAFALVTLLERRAKGQVS